MVLNANEMDNLFFWLVSIGKDWNNCCYTFNTSSQECSHKLRSLRCISWEKLFKYNDEANEKDTVSVRKIPDTFRTIFLEHLKVKEADTIKLLEENIDGKFLDIGLGDDFLMWHQKQK